MTITLPNYLISDTSESDGEIALTAHVAEPPKACVYCSGKNIVSYGKRKQKVTDKPVGGKPVKWTVSVRRMRCNDCNKTFTEPLPHINNKRYMTERLLKWIQEESWRASTSIANEIGVTEGTIRNVIAESGQA